jgi:hypothetical protein
MGGGGGGQKSAKKVSRIIWMAPQVVPSLLTTPKHKTHV